MSTAQLKATTELQYVDIWLAVVGAPWNIPRMDWPPMVNRAARIAGRPGNTLDDGIRTLARMFSGYVLSHPSLFTRTQRAEAGTSAKRMGMKVSVDKKARIAL